MKDVWLTTVQAAKLLGINARSMRRSVKRFQARTVPSTCGGATSERYEILLSSLPQGAQDAWQASLLAGKDPVAPDAQPASDQMTADILHAYERASGRVKRSYDKWARILAATDGLNGRKELEAWCESWNKEHPKDHTSAASIYRTRDRIAKDGRISLLLAEPVKAQQATVTDEWFEWFKETYLQENRLSMKTCRLLVIGRARREGQVIDDEEFPSVKAFQRRLYKEVAPSVIYRARFGAKRWNDRFGVSIIRNYEELEAGRCWVGDTRTWDVFVRVAGMDRPVTVYCTALLDFRTYMPMGWINHVCAPSTETSMRALRAGIDRYGLPEDLYLDNGKEYRNKDYSGMPRGHEVDHEHEVITSMTARLGIKTHFAEVRNAQAKIIERNWLVIKNTFDRLWATFKGGNVVEKPEKLKAILKNSENVPTFEEFCTEVDRFFNDVLPSMRCFGAHHNGMARQALWNKLISERQAPMQRISAEASSMLVTRVESGRIAGQGFHIAALDAWFWADWMAAEKGNVITIRYDPEDLRTAWCYDQSQRFIGTAQLREAVGALVDEGDMIGERALKDGIAQRKREARIVRELIPGVDPRRAQELVADLAASVAGNSEPVQLPPAPIVLTPYDRDAAARKRGDSSADYGIFAA